MGRKRGRETKIETKGETQIEILEGGRDKDTRWGEKEREKRKRKKDGKRKEKKRKKKREKSSEMRHRDGWMDGKCVCV